MAANKITFKVKKVSENDILFHLTRCNDSFSPPLNLRVNILEYSKKIFNNAITFEAWVDVELIGLIATYFNEEGKFGHITSVSVIKECSGTGIASKLLAMCLEYAKKNHYKELRLEVFKENNPAINFYKKFNFIQRTIKDDFIFMNLSLSN